jgi:hypothetical protein
MWESIPKDLNVQHHCCKNLKYCIMHLFNYHMVTMLVTTQITEYTSA